MLLNCKQCNKNVNNRFMHNTVCTLSLLTFMMVFMTWRLAQMKVYFSLLCDKRRIRMPKNVIECWLKCKIVIESDLRANDRFFLANECNFTQLFAFSRKWCAFSRNEQQKVNLPQSLVYFIFMFWVSPEGIPKTLAFWVRRYLKHGDTQNAVTAVFQ